MIKVSKIKKAIIISSIVGVVWSTTVISGVVYAQTSEEMSIIDSDESKYFDLKPLYLPILTSQGVTEHVSLLISVEIAKGDMEEIGKYRSRLMDAYIQDLYGAFSDGEAMIYGGLVNVENVRQRLVAVTQDTLGEKYKVNDILLQVVQQGEL